MIGNVIVGLTIVTMFTSAGLGYLALTRMKSTKREYFVLTIFSVVLYEMGYIFEMTAYTSDGGLVATKIMYAGSNLIAPFFLMFVQKYCEIHLKRYVNIFIFVTAFATIALVWTSDLHTWYYGHYWYDDISPVNHLGIEPAFFYPFGVLHPVFCIVISMVILIKKMYGVEKPKRFAYRYLIFGALAPVIPHTLYFLNLNLFGANYAPIFLGVSIIVLYWGVFKHDLLENEETIRSQNWLKEMISHLSHDMKTPLSVLSVNLESLSGLAETQSDPAYARHVRLAYQKNLDLQRLLQNLFEANRIETGRYVYAVKRESLLRLLAQIKERYEDYLEDKGIFFDITVGGDAELSIDSQRTWSVFDNIIYNAARYTGQGGSVTITAEAAPEAVTITVTDTGCGVTPEHLPRIFERFYKVSQARDATSGDSGLGLYIVKNIMEGCGGSVTAFCKTGEGL
ncbi:MAG: ATP-binding protein [Defluviitaleaceae bacterium]|nr:ATP-binding protein [Defluviitaleaceae bacterium]